MGKSKKGRRISKYWHEIGDHKRMTGKRACFILRALANKYKFPIDCTESVYLDAKYRLYACVKEEYEGTVWVDSWFDVKFSRENYVMNQAYMPGHWSVSPTPREKGGVSDG